MKVQVKQKDLLEALQKAYASAPTYIALSYSLPNSLRVVGTGNEIETASYAKCDGEGDRWEWALPAQKLLATIKSIDSKALIEICPNDEGGVLFKSGKFKFVSQKIPTDSYPAFPHKESSLMTLFISVGELRNSLQEVVYAAAKNDVRYFLNGVLLEALPDGLNLVATDGHRMAMRKPKTLGVGYGSVDENHSFSNVSGTGVVFSESGSASVDANNPISTPNAGGNVASGAGIAGHADAGAELPDSETSKSVILPKESAIKLITFMKSIKDDLPCMIKFGVSSINFVFSDGDRFSSKLIDGRFPNYRSVIKDYVGHIVVNTKELLDAAKRASVFSEKVIIEPNVEKNYIEIYSLEGVDGNCQSEVELLNHGGELKKVGYNASYLLEAVSRIAEDALRIGFDDRGACYLEVLEVKNGLHLIMPIRL